MEWQIYHFDQVSSTNETAKSFPENTVVVAACQSGGKGRYGRVWHSPKGNLYLSAVINGLGAQTPLLAFVAGVAVAEALADFSVQLKWPNDVLLNGGKVAGILLEQTEEGRVVIGIGVNVSSCPTQNVMYPTAHLNGAILLDKLEERILDCLKQGISSLKERGFEATRQKWLQLAVGLGQNIEVHLPDRTVIGLFKELSPQGELVLETPTKAVQKIAVGDVFLIKEK